MEGADGVKTGFTKAAGRILVSSATRDGRRLIAVTINAPDDWNDHAALLEDGFSGYSVRQIVYKGQKMGTVSVAGGQKTVVELIAQEDFSYALAPDEEPEIVLSGPGFVYAPVAEGEDAGVAYLCLGDKVLGKVPVLYGGTVEQEIIQKRHFWDGWFGVEKND